MPKLWAEPQTEPLHPCWKNQLVWDVQKRSFHGFSPQSLALTFSLPLFHNVPWTPVPWSLVGRERYGWPIYSWALRVMDSQHFAQLQTCVSQYTLQKKKLSDKVECSSANLRVWTVTCRQKLDSVAKPPQWVTIPEFGTSHLGIWPGL